MKITCIRLDFEPVKNIYTYTFQSLDTSGIWIRDVLLISAEKPGRYEVGQTYECKMEIG